VGGFLLQPSLAKKVSKLTIIQQPQWRLLSWRFLQLLEICGCSREAE